MTHAIARACRGILGSAVRIMSATAPVGFTVVILVAIASCACMAQEVLTPAALVKGTVVRLQWSAESGPSRGTVGPENTDAAGFHLRPSNRDAARRVSFSALESLEVRTSRDSRWGEGMLVGLVAGAIFPYVAADSGGDLDLRPLASIVLGSLGAGLGAVAGYSIATETWEPVRLR
jgi:hypothetical protein